MVGGGPRFFALAAIVLGAALVTAPFVCERLPTRSRIPADPWLGRTHPREHFTVKLETSPAQTDAASAVLDTLRRAWLPWRRGRQERLALHLERVLTNGQLWRGAMSLSVRPEPSRDGGLVEIRAIRGDSVASSYHFEFDAGRLVRSAVDRDSAGALALPEPASFPLAIGDLQVEDAALLLEALDAGRLVTAGQLAELRSRPLWVFDARFENESQAIPSSGVAAASMLLYVDPETRRLAAVRVFDEQDRLLRVYQDFAAHEATGALERFSVRSIVNDSHTTFEIAGAAQLP